MSRGLFGMAVFLGLTFTLAAGTSFAFAADKPVEVKLSKLKAPAPAEWAVEKTANRLRSFQFKLKGDDGDAELIVMPETNPEPSKSFPRWKASFVVPEGKTADDIGKQSKMEVAGATLHILDASGTWKFKERPFDPKSKEEQRDNYRVVWVIVVEGDDATHIRISGPQETMVKHMPGVEKWLKSLK